MWDHIIWSTSTIQVVWGIVNLSRNIHKLQIEDGSWTWIPHHTSFFPWYSQWFLEHLIGPIDIHHDDSPIHVTYHYVSLYIMFIHSTSLYIIMYHYIYIYQFVSLHVVIYYHHSNGEENRNIGTSYWGSNLQQIRLFKSCSKASKRHIYLKTDIDVQEPAFFIHHF